LPYTRAHFFFKMLIIGIDPGASGGLAWCQDEKVSVARMPQSDSEILDQLNYLSELSFPATPVCYLEKVSGFIGKPQPGSAMFKFGRNFGFLLGVLMALKFKINLVTPQKWQKSLGVGTKGKRSSAEWKRYLKDEATRLFPENKITLATSDALLILKFGCEKEK
tara:strand:- start:309 stop:800 length:492 start_codon:yes stop_codon:yes gene_type:complete